jgi:hypothetical protein
MAKISESEPVEYVNVVISGHETAEFDTEVSSDGSVLTNIINKVAKDFRGIFQEVNRDGEESITVHRTTDDGASTPEKVKFTVTSKQERVEFRVQHVQENDTVNSFYWEVMVDSGDEVSLTLNWNEMPTVGESTITSWSSPSANVALLVSDFEADAPTLVMGENSHSDFAEMTSIDRVEHDTTEVTRKAVALVDTTVDDDPATQFDESTTLDGAPVTLFDDVTQVMSHLPSEAIALIGVDSRQETTITTRPVTERKKSPPITTEEAEEVKNAVRTAFANALGDINKWIIDNDDVWVFEQGTGASLWKGNLQKSRYKKGVSDNDYELFLPVWIQLVPHARGSSFTIDLFDDDQAIEFERLAHTPKYMTGDWYFNPPVGIDSNDRDMGPIPDFEDEADYQTYLNQVVTWRYYLPSGITATQGGTWSQGYIEVPKGTTIGDEAVFDNPVTPADIIAATLTDTVTNDTSLRKILTDVSFFPYRKEHFMFGVPSVELPPPFGDDPLGDAGMGRRLLFLKWALEGVFLPSESFVFNQNLPRSDLELRTHVHQKLVQRAEAMLNESYEWGVYQEFAILLESAHLRMEGVDSTAELKPGVIPDYTHKHDNKIMKKTGKAVIRSVLAEMVSKQMARNAVLAVTPTAFDSDPDYLSFEDFIEKIAQGNIGSVGLSGDEVEKYLGAKLADDETFKDIRDSQQGITGFIEDGFDYLKNSVQVPNGQPYVTFLDDLLDDGLVFEHLARKENAVAVDRGIKTLGGTELPGRADLHGDEGTTKAKYSFIVTLQKRGYDDGASAGPITVTLDNSPGTELKWENITIPSDKDSLALGKKNSDDKYPFFTVQRDIANPTPAKHTHTFSLGGSGMSNDAYEADNEVEFESEFISLSGSFLPEFEQKPKDTRWVFRVVSLTNLQYQTMVSNELSNFEVHSAAVRNGFDPTIRTAEMALDLFTVAQTLQPGEELAGFTKQDIDLMSTDQLAALQHVRGAPSNSSGISTAEKISFAIEFANFTQPGQPYLLALEVPLDDEAGDPVGIEYLPITNGGLKRINAEEGNEVVYLDKLFFEKAYVFEIANTPFVTPGSNALTLTDTFIQGP